MLLKDEVVRDNSERRVGQGAHRASAGRGRLAEDAEGKVNGSLGPYLGERQWGTVREDYSRTATPGNTSRTTRRARAPIAGARTASPDQRP